MMPVASCIPFPFSAPCDDMLTMLVYATRWLYVHLYMLAYMFMHESWLLVCRPYFNTMKLWTSNPNLHLPILDTTFCLLSCLLVSLLAFVTYYGCHIYLACLLCTLFPLSMHLFLSIACLPVSCLCLCMYAHGTRRHGARAQSPRHKQKGLGCKHMKISQATVVNRFRSLAFPFGYVLF